MPNPRKPNARKKLEGTYRKDRDYGEPDLDPIESAEPPDWLISPEAVRVWEKSVRSLAGVRVLTENDLDVLGQYCNLHAKMVKLWRAGETPTGTLFSNLRQLAMQFGLTPASRSKVSEAGDGDSEDPAESYFSGPRLVDAEEDELPEWPLKTKPSAYLKRWPDGPNSDLARRIVETE